MEAPGIPRMKRRQTDLFKLARTASLVRFKKAVRGMPGVMVECDKAGDFLVHHAVMGGNEPVLAFLLDSGMPVNVPGDNGATPLHCAAAGGHVNMVRIMLGRGADVSPVNKNGMTPLHIAAGLGAVEIMGLLIGQGAGIRPEDRFGRMPVHYAAGAGRLKAVQMLASLDAHCLECRDRFGMRPLHWACYFECAQVASWLLQQGVADAPRDIYDRSPGFLARLSGIEKMKDLAVRLPAGREPGYTCPELHRAVLDDRGAEVRDILETTSSPSAATDSLGRSLMHCAAFARDRLTWNRCRESGILPNALHDQYGWTSIKLLSYRMMTTRRRPLPGAVRKCRSATILKKGKRKHA